LNMFPGLVLPIMD
jgi:hypothetical protein